MITITPFEAGQLDLLVNIAITSYKQTYSYLWLDEAGAYLERFYKKSDFEADIAKNDVYYFFV